MSFTIVAAITRIEEYDHDEDGYAHPRVVERIVTKTVDTTLDLFNALVSAEEDAADMGDGFSGTHILAVYEPENGNQRLPGNSECYAPSELSSSEDNDCDSDEVKIADRVD